ncbi:rhodanese-like domain-containing protein [Azospirillum sp. TSO22-1]|uniref:rhodanese-like domain-containing protein n=1 Tax=Azospirillum sp. TSO22-1 TaxID=716789 RepID=UPI000D616D35|nr:rhodanese-like domain-containing protein [Azospirillum sp. TSO22-1]PWC56057.1 sulfurtransferase [Azospirillum sp. TSO22-1]
MPRIFIILVSLAAAVLGGCQTTAPVDRAQLGKIVLTGSNYADETVNWEVPPRDSVFTGAYHSKTPIVVPGAQTITTGEVLSLIASSPDAVLIDVLGGGAHATIPTALWLNGAGLGENLNDRVQVRMAERLNTLTAGDRRKPLVFFCLSAQCWLSYNASLRAVALGYTNVKWYRGGQTSWMAAGLPTETSIESR